MTFMYNADDDMDPTVRRALVAYFETGGDVMPTSQAVRKIGGKRYVVLHRGARLLACYRVRNDGKLKRLVRLPVQLQD